MVFIIKNHVKKIMVFENKYLVEIYMERNPPKVNVMLSLEEKKFLVDFFVLLIEIDTRVNPKKSKGKKKRKIKSNQIKIRARNCGTCFLSAIALPLNHLVYI